MTLYENVTALYQIYKYLPEVNTIFELITNTTGIIPLLLSIHFFIKLKLFHINLSLLLINLMFAYLIRTFLRIPIVVLNYLYPINNYSSKNIYFQHLDTLTAICQYVCSVNLCSIFLERIFATTKANIYENVSNNFISITFISFQWLSSSIIVFANAFGYLHILILMSICVNIKTNLSYRYQVSENIRSFKMLIPMLMLLLLGCIFEMICFTFMIYAKIPEIQAFATIIFTAVIGLGSIILPIFSMVCHKTLRNAILKVFRKKCRKTIKMTKSEPTKSFTLQNNHQLTTLTGEKLIHETVETTDLYFQQIKQMWN